jgi:hypothetical protein
MRKPFRFGEIHMGNAHTGAAEGFPHGSSFPEAARVLRA